ncbi:unnamed protein product [Ixodes persulcatus]
MPSTTVQMYTPLHFRCDRGRRYDRMEPIGRHQKFVVAALAVFVDLLCRLNPSRTEGSVGFDVGDRFGRRWQRDEVNECRDDALSVLLFGWPHQIVQSAVVRQNETEYGSPNTLVASFRYKLCQP